MQNDFITGSLGSKQAERIVPNVKTRILGFDGEVIFTQDTHGVNYSNTQEGRKLPVEHCIKGTAGWQICDELLPYAENTVEKGIFGALNLPEIISNFGKAVDEIELCGLCTDICVISNAMILKSAFPEAKITVNEDLCAGVTEESHNTALAAMRAVQIEVVKGI